ncbi:GNAT family N-acetyltransferase [Actinomadura graeca]|uniref:GNAT family N-acetyltransferase n=1 Tax=Actinomadura graeca TaxID=2750812 RepID=A0ABX8R168_9ACTN|nr:GNAT family N-acetyltransferase [Actinomadura graeca]QXJ23457.1 GNAT family N-acetyltransferase [Actinomadura graeca]
MDTTVRRLGLDDLPDCQRLAIGRDWGAGDRQWRLLFAVGDIWGLDAPDGDGLAGTAVSTPYGRDVAAISMVLTAQRYERQGIAGKLMRHAMEHAGTAGFSLTATEHGRPLYERLGFREVGRSTTYKGTPKGPHRGDKTRPATPEDIPDVIRLDTEVFGAPRTALMEKLASFSEDFRVVRSATGLLGFGGRWRNGDQAMMGPLIARDEKTALTLANELTVPEPMRLDIDHRHPEVIEWAEKQGLRAASSTTVMERGKPIANDPARLFLPVAQTLG